MLTQCPQTPLLNIVLLWASHVTNESLYLSLSHQASRIAHKHESYTSVAIFGAQDYLTESEREEEIRAASGVNIRLVKLTLWVQFMKCMLRLENA